jgi:hypothetical protein
LFIIGNDVKYSWPRELLELVCGWVLVGNDHGSLEMAAAQFRTSPEDDAYRSKSSMESEKSHRPYWHQKYGEKV